MDLRSNARAIVGEEGRGDCLGAQVIATLDRGCIFRGLHGRQYPVLYENTLHPKSPCLPKSLLNKMRNFPSLQRASFFILMLCKSVIKSHSPTLRHDGHFWGALDRDGGGVGVAGLRLRQRLGHRVQEVDEPRLPARGLTRFHFPLLLL